MEGSIIDPVSHAVIGSAVAAMVPAGTHSAVVWGILIGAELPDIDFVLKTWKGDVAYLKNHRGATHGLVVQPVLAGVITILLRLVWPEADFGTVFLWTLLGLLSHVLFDFGNDYGTMGFWPFSTRRIAVDIIPIVDVGLLGLIAGGWLVHWLWPGNRQVIFTGVWVLVAAYVGLRLWLRNRAEALVAREYDLSGPCGEKASCGPGWQEERLTVHPSLLSLNAWRYVLQMPGEMYVGMVWVSQGKVSLPRRSRNEMDTLVKASLKSEVVTAFSEWVRRPRVEVQEQDGLYRVYWTDARYEVDGFSPFVAYAWLDRELKLLDEGLGKQRPENLSGESLRRRLNIEMGRQEP